MSNTVVRQILIFMTSQESVFLGIIKISFLKISNFLHWRFEYRSKNKLFQVKARRLGLIPGPGKDFFVFNFSKSQLHLTPQIVVCTTNFKKDMDFTSEITFRELERQMDYLHDS